MKYLSYCVTLQSDTVISQHSATSGNHKSLDYLTGATFLGACAGQLYASLGAQAWSVFHSGKVRFHNALPLDDSGHPAFPMPLSFFQPKYSQGDNIQQTYNLARKVWALKGVQPKQCREGFLCGDGSEVRPARAFRLKTAIDRNKGFRAAESQLFGYQFLAAGSRWYLQIDLDLDLDSGLVKKINECLTKKTLRIGRSRSAEFGSIKVEKCGSLQLSGGSETADDKTLLVYCLSDLALRDPDTGIPTLRPTTGLLGLPGGKLLAKFSHMRFRNYAPFNAYRGANDIERQVVVAGSVMTFLLDRPLKSGDLEKYQEKLRAGVGLYRQDGLGQLWLNPPFLGGNELVTMSIPSLKPSFQEIQHLNTDQKKLADWIKQTAQEESLGQLSRDLALRWLKTLKFVKGGPTVSQWRELAQRAQVVSTREDLNHTLFDSDSGLCSHGVSAQLWGQECHFGQTYMAWLKTFIDPEDEALRVDETMLCRSFAHLGRLAASRLRQEEKK